MLLEMALAVSSAFGAEMFFPPGIESGAETEWVRVSFPNSPELYYTGPIYARCAYSNLRPTPPGKLEGNYSKDPVMPVYFTDLMCEDVYLSFWPDWAYRVEGVAGNGRMLDIGMEEMWEWRKHNFEVGAGPGPIGHVNTFFSPQWNNGVDITGKRWTAYGPETPINDLHPIPYLYPVVYLRISSPETGIGGIGQAVVLWEAPNREDGRYACNGCITVTQYKPTQPRQVLWSTTPNSLVETQLVFRPDDTPSVGYIDLVMEAVMMASEGLGEITMCNLAKQARVNILAVAFGKEYREHWVSVPALCPEANEEGEITGGEGAVDGEGEEPPPGAGSGNRNPMATDCEVSPNDNWGMDTTLHLWYRKFWFCNYEGNEPELDEGCTINEGTTGDNCVPEGCCDEACQWASIMSGAIVSAIPGVGCDFSNTIYHRPFSFFQQYAGLACSGSSDHRYDIVAIDHNGESVCPPTQIGGEGLPSGGEACVERDESGNVVRWRKLAFKTKLYGFTHSMSNSLHGVHIDNDPCEAHDCTANLPLSTMYGSKDEFWVQEVFVPGTGSGAFGASSLVKVWRIYKNGRWYKWGSDGVATGKEYSLNWPTCMQGDRVTDTMPAPSPEGYDYLWNPNNGTGGGAGGTNVTVELSDTGRDDMRQAVAQGTATGMAAIGNMLASKIADAVNSGFIGASGGVGYGGPEVIGVGGADLGQGWAGQGQAGGGGDAETGKDEEYGTARGRIEDDVKPSAMDAWERSQPVSNELKADLEAFEATPELPVYTFDIDVFGEPRTFTLDLSGQAYGWGDTVLLVLLIIKTIFTLWFLYYWTWHLMRPLLMEGW